MTSIIGADPKNQLMPGQQENKGGRKEVEGVAGVGSFCLRWGWVGSMEEQSPGHGLRRSLEEEQHGRRRSWHSPEATRPPPAMRLGAPQ